MTREPSKPLVLAALLTASFVINLDTMLVNVALPAQPPRRPEPPARPAEPVPAIGHRKDLAR